MLAGNQSLYKDKIEEKSGTMFIQRKLIVGATDDPLEYEADAMAEKVMRMPEQNFIQRKCAHCEEEEKAQRKPFGSFIQRKESPAGTMAGDNISGRINASKGNGIGMNAKTQSFMEARFDRDFSDVKIHTGNDAIQMNRKLSAKAFTTGSDIYFNEGEYQPGSTAGNLLLAHELKHVVQQTETLRRQTGPATPALMTKTQFVQTMNNVYGVTTIRVGTMVDQIKSMGLNPTHVTSLPAWIPWDPGASAQIYQDIVDAFSQFNQVFSGFPRVDEILFYDTYYESGTGGIYTANADVAAMFGDTDLSFFKSSSTADKGLPFARSVPSGKYKGGPVFGLHYGGDPHAAPVGLPAQSESTKRIVFHELGHGLQVAAVHPATGKFTTPAVDPTISDDYKKAVGRDALNSKDLYDIGVKQVQSAIKAGTTPPAQYQITPANWNDPKWKEQPISEYMVSGDVDDDISEAVMAFVANPLLLKSRSPRRYDFINARKAKWQSRFSTPVVAGAPATTPSPATIP